MNLVRLICFVLLSVSLAAQEKLAGEWLMTYEIQDVHYYHSLNLTLDGSNLGGDYNGATIAGTLSGNHVHFVATDKKGKATDFSGTLSGDTMKLRAAGDEGIYVARHLPQRPPGPPRRHEFTPTVFYRQFSARTEPVLRVWPGDTIHTTTVDSGGTDGQGKGHGPAGNPQTGPFFIESAMPGDTLAVHFNRVRLNRDTAVTSAGLVPRAMTPAIALKMNNIRGPVRWHLDRERGIASIIDPPEDLKNFSLPVRPMMGCVSVAPRGTPVPAGDSAITGGNMDSNDIVEGATVFLPVVEPGALLYLGDGHAIMGDGEITGSGLETSMEVEFTVDLIHAYDATRGDAHTHHRAWLCRLSR